MVCMTLFHPLPVSACRLTAVDSQSFLGWLRQREVAGRRGHYNAARVSKSARAYWLFCSETSFLVQSTKPTTD